jgi:hypothetical protein
LEADVVGRQVKGEEADGRKMDVGFPNYKCDAQTKAKAGMTVPPGVKKDAKICTDQNCREEG